MSEIIAFCKPAHIDVANRHRVYELPVNIPDVQVFIVLGSFFAELQIKKGEEVVKCALDQHRILQFDSLSELCELIEEGVAEVEYKDVRSRYP